jgi:hypothetical protein
MRKLALTLAFLLGLAAPGAQAATGSRPTSWSTQPSTAPEPAAARTTTAVPDSALPSPMARPETTQVPEPQPEKSRIRNQPGDFGLGFDAVPLLRYVGNAFNNTVNNTIGSQFPSSSGQAITGRYFLEDNTILGANAALRGRARIGFGTTKDTEFSHKDGSFDLNATVEDSHSISSTNVQLAGGFEKRRGGDHLVGYIGSELVFGLTRSTDSYSYGNKFSVENPAPTATNFGGNVAPGGRVTEASDGTTYSLGLRGFIGAELFIVSQVSVGAEFGWGFAFSSTGTGSQITESFDGAAVQKRSTKTGGASSFAIDTDNLTGAINLTAYF